MLVLFLVDYILHQRQATVSQYYYIVVGVISSIWSVFVLIFQGSSIPVLPVCVAALACYALFGYTLRGGDDQLTRTVRVLSAIAGNLIITRLIGDKLHHAWLSTGWAVEGIALLMIGFRLRQRHLRVFGLIVLALVLLKLLFVDLAQVGTLERIFSFIVAGLVFLASSYAYSWFTQKMMSSDEKAAT